MSESSDKEAQLKNEINQKLEEHGFLANIRSQVRIETLKTARELANAGEIKKTKEMDRVQLTEDEDPALLALVKELLDYLKLDQTKEMLDLELAEGTEVAPLDETFPQIDGDKKVPYLLKIIQKCRERHQ